VCASISLCVDVCLCVRTCICGFSLTSIGGTVCSIEVAKLRRSSKSCGECVLCDMQMRDDPFVCACFGGACEWPHLLRCGGAASSTSEWHVLLLVCVVSVLFQWGAEPMASERMLVWVLWLCVSVCKVCDLPLSAAGMLFELLLRSE
jgi:hypothetical protein